MAFEAELDNPWDVYNLDEFLYFCCPECEIKKPNRIEFVKHALSQHSKAKEIISRLIVKEEIFEFGNDDENYEEEHFQTEEIIDYENNYIDYDEDGQSEIITNNFVQNHKNTNDYIIKPDDDFEKNNIISQDVQVKPEIEEDFENNSNANKKRANGPNNNSGRKNRMVHKELKKSSVNKSSRHPCTFCEKSYSSYYPLWYHIETVHKKSNRHKCEFCDKSYPVPSLLQYHIEVKHNESGTRKFQCSLCENGFTIPANLGIHLATVHKNHVGTIKCSTCENTLPNVDDLINHMRSEHSRSGKVYKKKTSSIKDQVAANRVNKKTNSHTNKNKERTKPCEVCGKTFTQVTSLKEHIKIIHEGFRLQCPKCEKGFQNKTNLSTHLRTVHEGKKDHICDICGIALGTKSDLKVHLTRVHSTQPKDQICSYCGKIFRLPVDLKIHIENIHENTNREKCHLCGREFNRKELLRRHMKRVHKETNMVAGVSHLSTL